MAALAVYLASDESAFTTGVAHIIDGGMDQRLTREEKTMKLLRYGPQGVEKPGLLDAGGKIRDLSGLVGDIGGATLSDEGLDRLRRLDASKLPEVDPSVRLGPCVAGTGKFICIGLNYSDHAAETGAMRCRPSRSSS